MTPADPFQGPVNDFTRDRWGRPLVIPPDGGKPRPYGRPSSWGKKIEDTYGLEQWQRRLVVVGMSRTPSLTARAAAITADPKAWTADDKRALNAIADDALTAAKANQAADIGTALHRMTERLDLGEHVDAPEPYATDLAAYAEGMAAHGLTTRPEWIECRMVCDELELAGTADRLIPDLSGLLELGGMAGPKAKVADVKTGESIEAAALGYAVQLAIYAHSDLYDVATGTRTPVNLDHERALILHLPAGKGTFTVYEVDIAAGWEAALLAADIDRWRKRKGLLTPVKPTAPTRADQLAEIRNRPHPTEGDVVDMDDLERAYQMLSADQRKWMARLTTEAQQAGVPFHAKHTRTARRFDIIRALILLARSDSHDDTTVRTFLEAVIGSCARHQAVPVGHLLGSLSAPEANTFARLITGDLAIHTDGDTVTSQPAA